MKGFARLDRWRYAQWPEGLLLKGDCEEILKDVPDDSVDMIFTDPPYGANFMLLQWDRAIPPLTIWQECYRVLKPGSFAFVMCLPRQDLQWRMIARLEEAGFDISYSPIYWTYAQGFPKAANISKLIDKRLGMEREIISIHPPKNSMGAYQRAYKEHGARKYELGFSEDLKAMQYGGIPNQPIPASPEAKALDGAYAGFQPKPAVEVVLVCQKASSVKHRRSDVYRILGGKYDYWYTQRTEVTKKSKDRLSKKWREKGFGTGFVEGDVIEKRLALRPDLMDEVILNRMTVLRCAPYKDSDITSTITQALDTEKGVTWLDDVKIPYESDNDKDEAKPQGRPTLKIGALAGGVQNDRERNEFSFEQKGRFPANILVSDDVLNDGEISSSHNPGSFLGTKHNDKVGGNTFRGRGILNYHNDSGSFSRYFSLDAWAQEHLPESVLRTFPFIITPKPSRSEKNKGLEDLPDRQMYKCDNSGQSLEIFGTTDGGRKPRKNFHPTVKSVKLVSYVLTMASRPGDVLLDPFIGSGTTGVSAFLLNRRIIGCEIDEESCYIAARRMEWARRQAQEESKQLVLFGEV